MSDILSIGASGISAYRKSLEVTGNNIANANTDGYVHRDATLATAGVGPSSPLTVTSQSGTGVSVDVIKRASDTFLRDAVWSANASSAQAQALATSMGQLERRVLMPTSTVSTSMQKFFSNLQDIANSPSSMSARTAALTGAQQIVDQFHSQISSINQEASFAETNINTVLLSANGYIGQLAKLNASIAASTGSSQQPNDLLDQRDKLVNQLSQLVSIKVAEEPSGKITVYLGESTGGAKLVDGVKANKLGSQIVGQRLDFVFDPGGTNAVTNQVTSGTLAGLQLYRSQCLYTRDSFNRLALAFANNMNNQHVQGVDLAGNKGLPLFSTDTLSGVPSQSNQGSAKLTIDPSSMGTSSSDTYVASYDGPSQKWTITAQGSKKSVSGSGDLTLDGLKFHFEGAAKSGDNFTINPLKDAAAGMRLLITDPTQWAMSLPLYADTNASNAGTASIAINKSQQNVPAPSLAQIQNVFSQSQTPGGAIGVKADGVVSLIPSGATNVTLSSLRTLPSATFGKDMNGKPIDPAKLMLAMKQGNKPIISLSINDGTSLKAVTLDFNKDLQKYLGTAPQSAYPSSTVPAPVLAFPTTDGAAQPTNSVTLTDLKAGQTVSLAGVTFTALQDMKAADVATAFSGFGPASLGDYIDPANPTGPAVGVFGGQLTDWTITASSGNQVDLTANQPTVNLVPFAGSSKDLHIFDGVNSGSIAGLADAINADLKFQGFGEQLTASAVNGVLTINALGPNQLIKASMVSNFVVNAGTNPAQTLALDATVESGFGGTNLQIFTREGRQLSGPVLSPDQAKKLLTVANGFLPDAVYMPPINTSGYRNLGLQQTSAPLTVTINKDSSASVKVAAYPQTDGAQATDNSGSVIAGAVYDLKVPDSMASVRLSGAAILGKSASDIAQTLEAKLTKQATVQSIKGQSVDWGSLGEGALKFSLNVNGADQTITMVRNSVVTGSQTMGSATYSVDLTVNSKDLGPVTQTFQLTRGVDANGNPTSSVKADPVPYNDQWGKLAANWSQDMRFFVNADGKLSIDLPPEVGSGVTNVSFAGTDAATLGLNPGATILNDAKFSYDGLPPVVVNILHQGGQDYLNFTLPQELGATPQTLNVSGQQSATPAQLSALGLQPTITADATGATFPSLLNVTYLGKSYALNITGASGSDNQNGTDLSWFTGSDGKLRLTSKTSDFSIAANNAALGFNSLATPATLSYRVSGSGASQIDLSAQVSAPINVFFNGANHQVKIGMPVDVDASGNLFYSFDASNPNKIYHSDTPGIDWSVDQFGHVSLQSSYNDLQVVAQTATDQANAKSLGFMATGISVARLNDVLTFSTTVKNGNDLVPPVIDTTKSLSRVADSLTITGPAPEDLIVAVQSSNVKTSTSVQGVAGDPVPAIQTIDIPANLQMSDMVSFDIPGLNFTGPLYVTGAQSVIDLSSILQNKINNSGATLKPTVSYDSGKNQLVVTFADNGFKPLVVSNLIRGNQKQLSINVHSVNDGVKPGSGTVEVQTLQSTLPISVGDVFNVTMKLSPNDTGLQSFDVKIGTIPTTQDFVNNLNKQIAQKAGIDVSGGLPTSPTPEWPVWASNNNGVITMKWRDVGDVPPVSVAQTNDISTVRRSLIASYPANLSRTNPVTPDFTVKVSAPGKIELIDKASGVSLATRNYTVGQPVEYLGMSFTINGDASVGDSYSVLTDATRTGDNRNAVLLGALQSKDALGANSGSFQDIYAAMSTQLSATAQAANDTSVSSQAAVASLQSAYDGKTGVSLDTEAANLLRFQQAYQASAEVINTAKALFDAIYKIM